MRAANFVEETTTSIAGTGGNGAVTLTAVSGVPRFSTVFGAQATTIRYVIEDTVAKKFETGIGVVSSNVLTRTRPQVTWDGTTYDDSTPSPLAFGSTPAAGEIKIRLSQTAENQAAVMPGFIRQAMTGRDTTWGDFPISAHYSNWNNAGASATVAANLEVYSYYRLDHPGLLTEWQLECMSAGAGSGLKSALYSLDGQGLPSRKIVGFNTIDISSTGVKTDATNSSWTTGGPVWLTPGWYAFGFVGGGNSYGIRAFTNANSAVFSQTPIGRSSSYAGYKHSIQLTGSYTGGMLDVPDLTGAVINTSHGHWLGLKVVS